MDSLKLSHRVEDIVSKFAMALAKLGPKTTISRGKVPTYLGMDIDLGTSLGTMRIPIIKYLQMVIDDFLRLVLCGTVCSGYKTMNIGNSSVSRWSSSSTKRSPSCCFSASKRDRMSRL